MSVGWCWCDLWCVWFVIYICGLCVCGLQCVWLVVYDVYLCGVCLFCGMFVWFAVCVCDVCVACVCVRGMLFVVCVSVMWVASGVWCVWLVLCVFV